MTSREREPERNVTSPHVVAGARLHPAVRIERSQQWDLVSRGGRSYRILVSRPLLPPPAGGYPVIYALDGNSVFGTMTETVALQSARPDVSGVAPALVVGIGYPISEPLDLERRTFDYTPEVARARLGARPDGTPWPPTGGASAFLDFIREELQPLIAREFPVDPDRQILFGHSFGGLFTLYTLFTQPEAFRIYIAGSPSIWFGDRILLEAERAFAARETLARGARLLIAVGALEQSLNERERAMPDGSPRAQWIERNRMVDNAREMAARLGIMRLHGLDTEFEEMGGEDHVSVIPRLVSRALRFALAAPPA